MTIQSQDLQYKLLYNISSVKKACQGVGLPTASFKLSHFNTSTRLHPTADRGNDPSAHASVITCRTNGQKGHERDTMAPPPFREFTSNENCESEKENKVFKLYYLFKPLFPFHTTCRIVLLSCLLKLFNPLPIYMEKATIAILSFVPKTTAVSIAH